MVNNTEKKKTTQNIRTDNPEFSNCLPELRMKNSKCDENEMIAKMFSTGSIIANKCFKELDYTCQILYGQHFSRATEPNNIFLSNNPMKAMLKLYKYL